MKSEHLCYLGVSSFMAAAVNHVILVHVETYEITTAKPLTSE